MDKGTGRGMDSFFAAKPEPTPRVSRAQAPRRMRTSITLSQDDADRLELLRMHLRRREGRGLTISRVVSLALEHLAEDEGLPALPSPDQES